MSAELVYTGLHNTLVMLHDVEMIDWTIAYLYEAQRFHGAQKIFYMACVIVSRVEVNTL